MATYEPILIAPPWVRDRVAYQGLTGAATSFRALAATATTAGDSVSATAFSMWNTTIEHSPSYPGGARARVSFMPVHCVAAA